MRARCRASARCAHHEPHALITIPNLFIARYKNSSERGYPHHSSYEATNLPKAQSAPSTQMRRIAASLRHSRAASVDESSSENAVNHRQAHHMRALHCICVAIAQHAYLGELHSQRGDGDRLSGEVV